jgi:hypothetical protein
MLSDDLPQVWHQNAPRVSDVFYHCCTTIAPPLFILSKVEGLVLSLSKGGTGGIGGTGDSSVEDSQE